MGPDQWSEVANECSRLLMTHAGGFNYICFYCGLPTKMSPYTDQKGSLWPSCCVRDGCVVRWVSFPNQSGTT